jgi:excisionase family DNA binding protein
MRRASAGRSVTLERPFAERRAGCSAHGDRSSAPERHPHRVSHAAAPSWLSTRGPVCEDRSARGGPAAAAPDVAAGSFHHAFARPTSRGRRRRPGAHRPLTPTPCLMASTRGPIKHMLRDGIQHVDADDFSRLEILTVAQVAQRVQLSPQTVMRAIRAGDLEASQLTQGRGGWRVHPTAIGRWMQLRSNQNRQTVAAVRPLTAPTARLGTPRRSRPLSGDRLLP